MLMSDDISTYPRIFVDVALNEGAGIPLDKQATHYLGNVLRLSAGDHIRVFNGRDGEWLCRIEKLGKKDGKAIAEWETKLQSQRARSIHLLFAPIKKARQDFLIEKAVELGVTDLYPVLTDFTQVRQINSERVKRQIIEAAEQCERQDIPKLHALKPLRERLSNWPADMPLMFCVERADAPLMSSCDLSPDIGVFIGPEGGLSDEEKELGDNFTPVSLGASILRSETAVVSALVYIMMQGKD